MVLYLLGVFWRRSSTTKATQQRARMPGSSTNQVHMDGEHEKNAGTRYMHRAQADVDVAELTFRNPPSHSQRPCRGQGPYAGRAVSTASCPLLPMMSIAVSR